MGAGHRLKVAMAGVWGSKWAIAGLAFVVRLMV